ncbi:CubicO group peptidase (beta-lactamase class C family) [Rhodanobacter sp. K2T2]|uniref:serine hydrolase domain-containing protein n=1 Tax=Rhodanobacter sp. K2T2 TaxID=2723085 RepID=UPI0015CA38AF|nr:serine hydrolase domain-containing protein [Rhodanobacter sp. K2T2]NYE27228.1 CubicO group peptidase (beta-lactamase class C family) [Rhodanobacter sp. K2T2]
MLRSIATLPLLCLSLTAAAAAPVPVKARPFDAQLANRIDADVQSIMQRTGTPGVTILVAERGHVVYRHAYGLTDRENHKPATVLTEYEIGSITKQLTAAAILQLQEAGKLHLDDKLSVYLPNAPHADEVTLRQLLSHTSGLPEYIDAVDTAKAIDKPATFNELMKYVADKPLDFPPGTHWSYSNTGYILAGRVIEVVSHETYGHYLQTHLLDRAGMTHTFTVAEEGKLPGMAIGYDREKGQITRARTIAASVGWAAGFLVSTVDDLQKWNLALRGGRIVTPVDFTLMCNSVKTKQGDAGYGLGLFVDNIDGQPRVGHTGGSLGFTTANEYFPRQDVQAIAFTNFVDHPEPGEMITTAIFEDMNPTIAADAMRPAQGENPLVTAKVNAYFVQLQAGDADSLYLADKLAKKMRTGLAKRLGDEFNGYGKPTALVFKGTHTDAGVTFQDYVIHFGPGSQLKFGIALDKAGKIGALSFG